MKKIFFITILFVSLVFIQTVFASSQLSPATFNISTKTVHIPYFEFGGKNYWLDLKLAGGKPLQFKIVNYGQNANVKDCEACATYDAESRTLLVPYFEFGGKKYWLTFELKSVNPIIFTFSSYGDSLIREKVTISPKVEVPANNSNIDESDLNVTNVLGEKETYKELPTLLMAETQDNKTILLGYTIPSNYLNKSLSKIANKSVILKTVSSEQSPDLSVRSTALALVMLRLSSGFTPEEKSKLALNVINHPKFEEFVYELEKTYKSDPYILEHIMNNDELVSYVKDISDDVYNNYKNKLFSTKSLKIFEGIDTKRLETSFNWFSTWRSGRPWNWYTDESMAKTWADPFVAHSDKEGFAIGNPTMLNYLLTLYEDKSGQVSKIDDWWFVPRCTSGYQKTKNSGAEQLLIDRFGYNIGTDVKYLEVSRKNGFIIGLNLVYGLGYILDIIADGTVVFDSMKCVTGLHSIVGYLGDASTVWDFLTTTNYNFSDPDWFFNNMSSMIETTSLFLVKLAKPLSKCGAENAVKSLTDKLIKVTTKVSNPVGWIWIAVDAINGLVPYAASWASDSDVIYKVESNGYGYTVNKVESINTPPVAKFSYSPTTIKVGDIVTFTNLSTDADGDSLTYKWNFGDNNTDTSKNPTHSYLSAGIYRVTLLVKDSNGGKDVYKKIITVSEFQPLNHAPVAKFSYSPTTIKVGDTVTFTNSSTDADGDSLTYKWNFGDGKTSTSKNPTHSYSSAGSYTVKLTVKDTKGATNTASKIILVNQSKPLEMKFVFVNGGCYEMGDPLGNGVDREKPVHEVCVDSFYIGKYEVTQGQWKNIMGSNPAYFKSCGDNCPVEKVSWYDVKKFINKLNNQTGKHYRLPTEAEWEYAARSGGKKERYSGGNNVNAVGWYKHNSGGTTHPVGQKQANGLGIYDMSGNVWEWCSDWYDKNYYSHSPRNNPKGPSSGSVRVIRGGRWDDDEVTLRVAYHFRYSPEIKHNSIGFRLVLPAR